MTKGLILICSALHHFRLHQASHVRDARGVVLLQTGQDRPNSTGTESSSDDDLSYRALECLAAQSASDYGVRFISDEKPDLVLREILQAENSAMPFCIFPESADSSRLLSDSVSDRIRDADGTKNVAPTLPRFQCLSSGTSGTARRIERSHQSWIASFDINGQRMQIGAEDRYAIIGVLSHSLPLYAALEACHLGADVQLLAGLRPDRLLQFMATSGSTILYLTPTQARQLCAASAAGSGLRFGVRHLLCGGGKLDEKTRLALARLFPGAQIVEFYGASETSFITMSTEDTPAASVGSAYPGVSIRVKDEHGQPASGSGEIWVKSDYLFLGYASGQWRDTRLCDGYLSIGEMGWLDDSGNLYLSGRKSRRANVADNTIFLQEIEEVMLQHMAVHHCVVVAKQDELRGEVLVAVVEGKSDAILRRRLLQHARLQLGAILAPKQILFLERLPVLGAGKPDIREIQSLVNSL